MGELSLREATVADAEGIARVHVDSWRVAYRGLLDDAELDGLSAPDRAVTWRGRIERGVEVLVAAVGAEVVGFCALRREPGQSVEIAALYLDPQRRREGIGTQLVQETITRLRAAGDPDVALWVLEGNESARAFYRHHAFTDTGESDRWHGARELRMHRVLTS